LAKSKEKILDEKIETVVRKIEMILVNGSQNNSSTFTDEGISFASYFTLDYLLKFYEKEDRMAYMNFQLKFVEMLTGFSIQLKELPTKTRGKALEESLTKLNNWIETRIRSKEFKYNSRFKCQIYNSSLGTKHGTKESCFH
jgi:hypothetical protein